VTAGRQTGFDPFEQEFFYPAITKLLNVAFELVRSSLKRSLHCLLLSSRDDISELNEHSCARMLHVHHRMCHLGMHTHGTGGAQLASATECIGLVPSEGLRAAQG